MTDDEKAVIEILVNQPKSLNAWGGPIHAVDKGMKWDTAKTEAFVNDLVERKLIIHKSSGFVKLEPGEKLPLSQWWWERPTTEPSF